MTDGTARMREIIREKLRAPVVKPDRRQAGVQASNDYLRGLDNPNTQAQTQQDEGYCSPSCEVCQGVGYIQSEEFGKIERCVHASRYVRHDPEKTGLSSNEMDQLTWSSVLNVNNVHLVHTEALHMMASGRGWLTIYGDYGTGKTLIAKTAVAEALRNGYTAMYANMTQILDNLRAGFDGGVGVKELDRLAIWQECPFLVIDEFDKIRGTAYEAERSFTLLDYRYQHTIRDDGNLVTIVAMNTHPEKMQGYIASRLYDGRFRAIEMAGADLRPAQNWTKNQETETEVVVIDGEEVLF